MRMHAIMLTVLGGLLMLNGYASGKNSGEPDGLYKNAEAKAIAFESYDKSMELWKVEYEEEWVETEYGRTHIIVSGPREAKPLFLIPGLFADATMWYANAGALAENYRVIALDQIVYGGKSEPSDKSVTDITDYKAWFTAIMDHFGYERAAIAGLSYGSWLSLALAREIPESIAAVIMLDPSETFVKMRASMAWKGFRYFMFFPNRNKYRKFFDWIGGDYTDPDQEIWFEHMLDVIEYGSVGMMDVPQHRVYTAEELTMMTMPLLILAGGKPIIYKDPKELAAAAARAVPHAEIEIVPDTGHSLNMEKADAVNERMMRFLADNY